MESQGGRVVESKTEARAGVTGHNVRYVLVAGTAGVIAAFVIVWLYFFV
jgi:Flp pilus assembly protein TadB